MFQKIVYQRNVVNKIFWLSLQSSVIDDKQANEISIGANSHSERRRTFNGSFAIVRVYDKALTEAQINENIESAFDVEPVGKLSTTWSSIKEQY